MIVCTQFNVRRGFIDVDEKTTTEYWEMVRGEIQKL